MDPQHWSLSGPQTRLSRAEVCARLGVSDKRLRTLIAQGRFPPGIPGEGAKQEDYWWEQDPVAYLWLRLRGAASRDEEPDPDDTPAPKKG